MPSTLPVLCLSQAPCLLSVWRREGTFYLSGPFSEGHRLNAGPCTHHRALPGPLPSERCFRELPPACPSQVLVTCFPSAHPFTQCPCTWLLTIRSAAWSLADSQVRFCLTRQLSHIHTGFPGLAGTGHSRGRCTWSAVTQFLPAGTSVWECLSPTSRRAAAVPPPGEISVPPSAADLAQLKVRDGAGVNEGLCDDREAGVDVVRLVDVKDKLGVF